MEDETGKPSKRQQTSLEGEMSALGQLRSNPLLIDSLFDKHLISFDDDGNLLISSKLPTDSVANLNLENCSQSKIDKGMLKYVRRHRQKFEDLETAR